MQREMAVKAGCELPAPLRPFYAQKPRLKIHDRLLVSITTHQESQKNDDSRIHSRTQTWKTTDTIAKCIISPDAEKVKRYAFFSTSIDIRTKKIKIFSLFPSD